MHNLGTITLLAGMAVLLLAQFYVAALVFTANPLKGMLCFAIPGYVLLHAKRNGFYGKFLLAYAIGIVGMIIGGAILS